MTAVPPSGAARAAREDMQPAFRAARVQLGFVFALFALAGLAWWWTARRMQGMDAGPRSTLGGFGWFLAVWVVAGGALGWDRAAQPLAGAMLVVAAGYELTPLMLLLGAPYALPGLIVPGGGSMPTMPARS